MYKMLLAFGSQARTGKDTACKYLQEKYGGGIYHFSDSLYKILHYAQEVCGFDKEKDVRFLQWVGTEWGRNKNPEVWIERTIANLDKTKHCYIADVRFKNEAEALKKAGFTLIRIVRADRPIDRDPKHQSETDLEDYNWDYVIENNGSLEEFYAQIVNLAERKMA